MMLNPTPLKPNALAPNFNLQGVDGSTFMRSQFRNKSGLTLIFTPSVDDPGTAALLAGIEKDRDWYTKIKAKVFVIARQVTSEALSLPVLDDHEATAWRAYTGLNDNGYGVFVLDRYGGVDTQLVTDDPAALPDAETLREWVQATMYKCSI